MTVPLPDPPPAAPPFRQALPKAPGATLSMVLGIVSVAGFFVLVVPVFAAPFAWYLGSAAHRRVEREPARWSGSGEARAGMVLGVVGTGLVVVLLAALLLVAGGLLLVSRFDAGYGT